MVPKAKTKEQRKAERKKMTLEERIEEALPVNVQQMPSAGIRLPGNNQIRNVKDLKKVAKKTKENVESLDNKAEDAWKKTTKKGKQSVNSLDDKVEEAWASTKKKGKQVSDNSIASLEEAKKYVNETIPNYGKEVKQRTQKTAKEAKKIQSKVFDGKKYKDIAVTKKIRKQGSGKNLLYHEFYVLKEHQAPLSYHRKMTWYEEKNKRFHQNVLARDPKTNALLHGPYREYRGEKLIKEGHYYLGVKDGRWLEYDQNFVLLVKENYNKGFFSDSDISYWEGDSTKIKEITPIIFGKISGDYYSFFKDGTMNEEGKYDNGKKVGLWIEYYEGGGHRRKKETQHPSDYYDNEEPVVLREYDENRKVTFEQKKN